MSETPPTSPNWPYGDHMLSDPADDRPRGRALDAAWWLATACLLVLVVVALAVRMG